MNAIINNMNWTPGHDIVTAQGVKSTRSAEPTQEFWDLWRTDKDALKNAGYRVRKDRGEWKVTHWMDPSGVKSGRLEMSRALTTAFEAPCPAGLEPLPHQNCFVEYAGTQEVILNACEPGLGKTIMTALHINHLMQQGIDVGSVLIVCPATLKMNWARELRKWLLWDAGINVIFSSSPSAWTDDPIQIINYEMLMRQCTWQKVKKLSTGKEYQVMDEWKNPIVGRKWGYIACDEVHRVSETTTKTFKTIHALKWDRLTGLTGTPIRSRPKNLWGVAKLMDPNGLGRDWYSYHTRYCDATRTRWGLDITGSSNEQELGELLRERFMYRVTRDEALPNLPDVYNKYLELPYPSGTKRTIKKLEKELEAALAKGNFNLTEDYEELSEGNTVAFELQSKYRLAVGEAKVASVVAHTEMLLDSGPVVVFYHHQSVGDALKKAFPDASQIDGRTPTARRDQQVQNFQNGKTDVFLGQLQAASEGITLTRANQIVLAEGSWVPSEIVQATSRLRRIGQKNNIVSHHMVLADSLDARMTQVMIEKAETIGSILDKE